MCRDFPHFGRPTPCREVMVGGTSGESGSGANCRGWLNSTICIFFTPEWQEFWPTSSCSLVFCKSSQDVEYGGYRFCVVGMGMRLLEN